jgi:hypothetical protein
VKKSGRQVVETKGYPNYGRTAVEGLKKSRKGKHHDLMTKIMEDLRESASGTEQVSILNLRSAIVRVAAKEGIAVSTSSDDENFYVWKAPNHS